jgi:hypothetical protein
VRCDARLHAGGAADVAHRSLQARIDHRAADRGCRCGWLRRCSRSPAPASGRCIRPRR